MMLDNIAVVCSVFGVIGLFAGMLWWRKSPAEPDENINQVKE